MDVGGPQPSRLCPSLATRTPILKTVRLANVVGPPLILRRNSGEDVNPAHSVPIAVGWTNGELVRRPSDGVIHRRANDADVDYAMTCSGIGILARGRECALDPSPPHGKHGLSQTARVPASYRDSKTKPGLTASQL
jgi:hypothetical protein